MDYTKFSWDNLVQFNINLQDQISVFKEEKESSERMRGLLEGQVQLLTETHHHSLVSQQEGVTNGNYFFMSNLVEQSNKRALDSEENEQLKKWQELFYLHSKLASAKPAKRPLRVFKSGSQFFVLRPDLLEVLSLKNTKLIHLSKAKIDSKDFVLWSRGKTKAQLANSEDFKVGTKIDHFYVVDKHLVSLLEKYSDTSSIADELRVLI
jgi:hypothetical protein